MSIMMQVKGKSYEFQIGILLFMGIADNAIPQSNCPVWQPPLHMIFIAIEPWHPLLKTEQTAFILLAGKTAYCGFPRWQNGAIVKRRSLHSDHTCNWIWTQCKLVVSSCCNSHLANRVVVAQQLESHRLGTTGVSERSGRVQLVTSSSVTAQSL